MLFPASISVMATADLRRFLTTAYMISASLSLRRQADVSSDRSGMKKALWLIDRGAVGERDHRADTGHGHEPSAHRIMTNGVEQQLVERGQLLTHHPSDRQQRLDDGGQSGKT